MAKEKEIKTNAMRILDKNKVSYTVMQYECDEFIDGLHTADQLGLSYDQTFKTLVTVGKSKNYFVFVIPIHQELDLKAAAKSVGEKNVEMIHVKDITAITGYVRGGCTSSGMKKQFPTVIDESPAAFDKIHVSGCRIGTQLTLNPNDLIKVTRGKYADIIMHN